MDDSVRACILRDTTNVVHGNWRNAYKSVHRSAIQEFLRLASSRPRTFSDVIALKEITSAYKDDTELAKTSGLAASFFLSLYSIPYYNSSKEQIITESRSLLDKTLKDGIHGEADLLAFIRKEDLLFRGFLSHLSELADANLTDITKATEQCCRMAIKSADRGEMTHKDVLVHLARRTNRRVILNAKACIEDINKNKVKTPDQARAYLWMLLQPYSAMDGFCMAVLSEKDRKELYAVADATPKAVGKLVKILQLDEIRTSEMPALFMKVIISTLKPQMPI